MWILFIIMGIYGEQSRTIYGESAVADRTIGYKSTSSQLLFYQMPIIPIGQMENTSANAEAQSTMPSIGVKAATEDKSWMWKEPLGGAIGGVLLCLSGVAIGSGFMDPEAEFNWYGLLGAEIGSAIGTGSGVAFVGHNFVEKKRERKFSWLAALGGGIVGSAIVPIPLVNIPTAIAGSIICYKLSLQKDNTGNKGE